MGRRGPPRKPDCELKHPRETYRCRAKRAKKGASSNKPQGADQPAEEVEATSVGSTRESGGLNEDASDLAQLLAGDSQAWWVEEPAAYKTQSESDVGSRKRAHCHTESDESSECSESIASKVARLA